MCTVTLVSGRERLRVMCNRDERHERPAAHPPLIMRAGGSLAVLPIDPQGGGTWIAGNSAGLVFALLNGAAAPRGTLSRGRLILDLLDCVDLAQVTSRARTVCWRDWPAHRLLVADTRRVLELRLRTSGVSIDAWGLERPVCFTSPPPGDLAAEPLRRALFDELVTGAADTLAGQQTFHHHHWPDRPHQSVHMRRHDVGTQSLTSVDVSPQRVQMTYAPTRDVVGAPAALSIPRRGVGARSMADDLSLAS
jgi:hypothetical protein